jgi:hypothetical protein
MTEEEWLACEEPEKLLDFLRGRASHRKLRLFACACCRRLWGLLDDERSRRAVEAGEDFADGLVSESVLKAAKDAAIAAAESAPRASGPADEPDRHLAAGAASFTAQWFRRRGRDYDYDPVARHIVLGASLAVCVRTTPEGVEPALYGSDEYQAQVALLRDIFAWPTRQVTFKGAWRTAPVRELAQAAYDERVLPPGELSTHRLAVLSDALEEAGCDDEAILSHLRLPGPHVRGCWALDLLLNKD